MRKLSFGLAAALLITASSVARADKPGEPFAQLDRAQTLVMNLNKVAGSTGFYLLQDIRNIKGMDHDLTKALRQAEEVDKTYGKLRGRPDEKHLQAVTIKIEKALQSRALFEEDLKDAYSQLKVSIQETMVTDEARKLGK
jgi:nitrogen regulatory protein PII-like uncharacterized protein